MTLDRRAFGKGILNRGTLDRRAFDKGIFNRGTLDRRAFDKGTTQRRVSQELPLNSYPVLDYIINQSVKITHFLCSTE